VLRHRTVGFLLVLALLWAGGEVLLRLTAPGRIDPALARTLGTAATVDVAVTLGFAPEDFHIRLFQGYGVVSGVRGATVLLNRVPPDGVRRIARHYWVRTITPQ
jgi:hypothetical protein